MLQHTGEELGREHAPNQQNKKKRGKIPQAKTDIRNSQLSNANRKNNKQTRTNYPSHKTNSADNSANIYGEVVFPMEVEHCKEKNLKSAEELVNRHRRVIEQSLIPFLP